MKVTFKLCNCWRFDSGLFIQDNHPLMIEQQCYWCQISTVTHILWIHLQLLHKTDRFFTLCCEKFIHWDHFWMNKKSFIFSLQTNWNKNPTCSLKSLNGKNETLPFYCRKKFWRIVTKRKIAAFSGCRCDTKSWSNPSVLSVNEKFHTKPCLGSLSLKGLSTIRLIYNYESVAM